jgi:hypothetical protein
MTVIATLAMMPPGNRSSTTTNVNGRSYTCNLGSVLLNVPYFDAEDLECNGWIRSCRDGSGTTANRPTTNLVGGPLSVPFRFIDTTLNTEIIWDGVNWRNPITGAII